MTYLTTETNNADMELLRSNQEHMEKLSDYKYASKDALSDIRKVIEGHEKIFEGLNTRIGDHIDATNYLRKNTISIIALCVTIVVAVFTVFKVFDNSSSLTQIKNDDKMILSKLDLK
jgi:hypothetical protein